ncbi:MAG: hypothetical protein ACYC91_17845 [Solirubrobacteraceae bacterium]
MRRHIDGLYRSLGARRAAALGAGVLVALVLVLVVVLGGSGKGKPGRRVATAGTPSATMPITTPSASAPRRRRERRRERRRKRAAHHAKSVRPARRASRAHGAPKAGGGGSAAQSSAPSAAGPISLVLHGGGDATSTACGATHHYRTYAIGAQVRFSGTVQPIPSGTWKVKLSIKVCAGGGFSDFTKIDVQRDKHRGTFSGSFPAPAAGRYSVRAELYVNGSVSAKSNKRHFETP